MATIARLSHVGFNVPRELFEKECEFWEHVIGLQYTHGTPGVNAFFTADPLRDHEFILYAVDGPVPGKEDPGCMLNHVGFDVATNAEVDEFTTRLRAHGFHVDEPERGRRQNKVTSPAGIHFEMNTPPYLDPAVVRD
ncbi:MAG TPA: VOC family protein [Chloroflexota bacterium]|nr:VOC family protein [Chloroflexota bacterium]